MVRPSSKGSIVSFPRPACPDPPGTGGARERKTPPENPENTAEEAASSEEAMMAAAALLREPDAIDTGRLRIIGGSHLLHTDSSYFFHLAGTRARVALCTRTLKKEAMQTHNPTRHTRFSRLWVVGVVLCVGDRCQSAPCQRRRWEMHPQPFSVSCRLWGGGCLLAYGGPHIKGWAAHKSPQTLR